MLVSAQTGYGMDVLAPASPTCSPSCGKTSTSRAVQRGRAAVARQGARHGRDLYRARDVRVRGRVAPVLAGELRAAGGRWQHGPRTRPFSSAMTELEVACVPEGLGWSCRVTVSDDDGTKTEHQVSVTRNELERYAPGRDVRMLVNASFRFLLSNEPKESILGHFAISDIERCFPTTPTPFPRASAARPKA